MALDCSWSGLCYWFSTVFPTQRATYPGKMLTLAAVLLPGCWTGRIHLHTPAVAVSKTAVWVGDCFARDLLTLSTLDDTRDVAASAVNFIAASTETCPMIRPTSYGYCQRIHPSVVGYDSDFCNEDISNWWRYDPGSCPGYDDTGVRNITALLI